MSMMETLDERLKDPDRVLRVRKAIYQLHRRQFIWAGDRGTTGLYEAIVSTGVLPLIEDYFEVSGMRLQHNTAQQWLGLVADPEFVDIMPDERLTGDETIILLLLALAWQDGINKGNVENRAVVKIKTNELLEQLHTATGKERIKAVKLRDILKDFARRSLVSLGEENEETFDIEVSIRPMVTQLTGRDALERLAAFAAAGAPANEDDQAASTETGSPDEDPAEGSDGEETGQMEGIHRA
jgi:hypothetical protein